MKGDLENGPAPERLRGRSVTRSAKRLFLATRPMFFPASVLPVVVGTVWGARDAGAWDFAAAALALAATVLVHAGANVVNDVHDDINGTDPINTGRIYPFTGGPRFIQADILDRETMKRWGVALLGIAGLLGLGLAVLKGPVVLALGLAGAGLGFAYSAPPLQLCARGLGELAVAIGFGVLPVTGAAWLQSGAFGTAALLLSLPLSLWVFNILLINEIPDVQADKSAGKRTVPVRIGVRGTAVVYAAAHALALGAVALAVAQGVLPALALALPCLLCAGALALAARLARGAPDRRLLTAAIMATLAIHTAGGLWLTVFVWP